MVARTLDRTLLFLLSVFTSTRAFHVLSINPITAHNLYISTPQVTTKLKATQVANVQEKKAKAAINVEQLQKLNQCKSGTEACNILNSALNFEESLYNSLNILPGVSEKGISDADLAIQTKIRNNRYSILELIDLNGDKDADRSALALICIMAASMGSALVLNESLPGPEILRFLVVWILSFTPLGFVGVGLAMPQKLQTFLTSVQREIFPVYRKRMIQHEAGHFLMGHLLGLPVKNYSANAVKNAVEFYPLNDPQVGQTRATLLGFDKSRVGEDVILENPQRPNDAPYFSKEGRGGDVVEQQSVFRNAKNYTEFLKLPARDEPRNAWPYRGFDYNTLDKLSVISTAGVCAEILAFGNAEGGYADFAQLRQLFNSAQTEMDEREMENRIRYALGYTMSQLRLHLGVLDALAEEMERGASVATCVKVIEDCENRSGNDGIMADYDKRRRERFRSENVGILEKMLLGGKNADTEETQLEVGIGGGGKTGSFAITGDDPLYFAIGVAFLFFVWASTGGLSLH